MSSQQASLNLSILEENTEHYLTPCRTNDRCLIQVKLTESCAKAIDTLITSNKGAFFSLWFTQNGGHLSMASTSGGDIKFHFTTASLNKVEKLECLHQHLENGDSQITCMGVLQHKLTIKATDDVYEATKQKAKDLEKGRQEIRAKEIEIAKVSNKSKLTHTSGGGGSTSRSYHSKSVGGNKSTFTGTNSEPKAPPIRSQKSLRERIMYLLALKSLKKPDIVLKLKKATKRGESSLTNLDAVLNEVSDLHDGSAYHLKPSLYAELDVDSWPFYSEPERGLVKRKLQAVYRQPVTSSNADSLISRGEYTTTTTTPSNMPTTVNTATSNSSGNNSSSSSLAGLKRPAPSQKSSSTDQFVSKKSKTTLPTSTVTSSSSVMMSSSIMTSSGPDHQFNEFVKRTDHVSDNEHIISKQAPPQATPILLPQAPPPVSIIPSTTTNNNNTSLASNSIKKERNVVGSHKRKKKKKKHMHALQHSSIKEEELSVGNDLTKDVSSQPQSLDHHPHHHHHEDLHDHLKIEPSPPNALDFSSEFPSISTYEERTRYKNYFNQRYDQYVTLKRTIDSVHEELLGLSHKLESLPHNTPESKELKSLIKDKLQVLQKDQNYQEKKTLLLNLHFKLDHVKKMVTQYDASHSSHL